MTDLRDGSFDPVDELLRGEGERWRAAGRNTARTPTETSVLRPAADRPSRPVRTLASLVGVAGTVVLLVLVAVSLPPGGGIGVTPTQSQRPVASAVADPTTTAHGPTAPARSPTPAPTPAPTAMPPAVVRDGDAVAGTGFVVRFADGTTKLCGWGPVLAVARLQCAQPSVDVVIRDPTVLPGWGPYRDEGHRSDWVRLEGRWIDAALHVEVVGAAERVSPYGRRESPCAPPAGGWADMPPDSLDAEQAGLRLQRAIDARPSLYSGIGAASADEDGVSRLVVVVGTVGDVEAVRRDLAEHYPYNLCVIEVAYSRADLEPVRDRLASLGTATSIDVIDARVIVDLPLLTEAAAAAIGGDADKVTVRPLLEKVTSP